VKLYSAQVRKRWGGDDWFAPVLDPASAHWVGCLATTLPPGNRVPGFETRYLNLLRNVAAHARMTTGLGAQTGWLLSAFNGVLVATWVQKADDHPAIERARVEAQQLLSGLLTLRKLRLPMAHEFLEEVIDAEAKTPPLGDAARADAVAPPEARPGPTRLTTLRGLVSRTVLQMAESTPS